MSRPRSAYFSFYCKCMEAGNPYALYVESIKRAFVCLDFKAAIQLSGSVKHCYPLAELLYIMLNSCAGHADLDAFNNFKTKHTRLKEVEQMRDALIYHINRINSRHCGTFERTLRFNDLPECWESHLWRREFNGERCLECIYYYLLIEIVSLS